VHALISIRLRLMIVGSDADLRPEVCLQQPNVNAIQELLHCDYQALIQDKIIQRRYRGWKLKLLVRGPEVQVVRVNLIQGEIVVQPIERRIDHLAGKLHHECTFVLPAIDLIFSKQGAVSLWC
jgi:hypothetical protein